MSNIRWIQRFENLQKSINNLLEAKKCIEQDGPRKIYTMALIQAFEIAFELSWKTMKNYLEYNGIVVDTPRSAIKESFANHIITNGQSWIDMMEARNTTSHTYNEEYANELVNDILNIYIPQIELLKTFFEGKTND